MVPAGMNLGQLAPAPAPTAYHAPAPVLRCGVRRPLGVSAQTDAAVAWQQAAATGAPWAGTSELPHLDRMGGSGVPPVLAQKIFTQIFSYINVQLFNSLLRRECCSFSNGEYVKAGLAELELWCAKATTEYAASSWDELKHIRQAVGFLVLSVQQLYRICTQYWDDKYNTQSVSSDVLRNMRVLMTDDSNNAESSSFLLDDNSSIPFSVDDITYSIQEKDFSDVKPAEELLENPAFQFLQE
ncbi:myosin-14-like isoform X2 [Panicum virgatum]|uniref:myosin-14-like isoform X2 n=1 Tax=Panicum virgatum TaxID=38727 RepID=UPI0019D52971|nr:myosin-14-like isoform X2 [Panicum virgatum]